MPTLRMLQQWTVYESTPTQEGAARLADFTVWPSGGPIAITLLYLYS